MVHVFATYVSYILSECNILTHFEFAYLDFKKLWKVIVKITTFTPRIDVLREKIDYLKQTYSVTKTTE